MEIQALESDLEKYIIEKMCASAATGLELQCSREYWNTSEEGRRAMQIHKLSKEERENLPTENLCAERYLAKFGALASDSAKHSNKLFKAKRIKDDLCLIVANECDQALRENRNMYKILDTMERDWTHEQKALFKEKLKESISKNNCDNFVDAIIKKMQRTRWAHHKFRRP